MRFLKYASNFLLDRRDRVRTIFEDMPFSHDALDGGELMGFSKRRQNHYFGSLTIELQQIARFQTLLSPEPSYRDTSDANSKAIGFRSDETSSSAVSGNFVGYREEFDFLVLFASDGGLDQFDSVSALKILAEESRIFGIRFTSKDASKGPSFAYRPAEDPDMGSDVEDGSRGFGCRFETINISFPKILMMA